MDANNVIELKNNIDELEAEMNVWLNLTFDQRKRADATCIELYGCTNIELYNRMKSVLLKNTDIPEDPIQIKSVMTEAFRGMNADNDISDLSKEMMFNKIQTSLFLQENDRNIVIINDFLSDIEPDYTLKDLYKMYSRYESLPPNYKGFSNDYSMELWGRAVPEMFDYMKSKLESGRELDKEVVRIKRSRADSALVQYRNEMSENAKENFLELSMKKIDCLTEHKSLSGFKVSYESAVLESFAEEIDFKPSGYELDIPSVTPFFTYDKFVELTDTADITPFNYVTIDNQKQYYTVIHDLQTKLANTGDKSIEEQIIKLGWNPYVKITAESMKYAREKQIEWFNLHEKCKIINLENYTTNLSDDVLKEDVFEENSILEPIFIVLVHTGSLFGKAINWFKKSQYSHAGLSLSSTLEQIFTFGIHKDEKRNDNGLTVESLDDYTDKNGNANLLVLALFVDPQIKTKIEKALQFYINNKEKTKYSFKNIARIILNKTKESTYSLQMVCSQFVDSILKLCDINLNSKSSNLVAPSDLEKADDGINMFVLFEGKKLNYDSREIDKKVNALKHQVDYNRLNVYRPELIVGKLKEYTIEGFNIDCKDEKISAILKEMREYIKPSSSIVVNELKVPFGFNNKGDLLIALPKDLQSEYDEAHKLLSMYDETNVQGIKHELARLLYLNNVIEKKMKKTKKSDKEYKELMDLRARVMNDFSTYFKLVKSIEKDFDFMDYMKSSEYYNKYLVVDNSTLKQSGSLIKKFMKIIK